MRILGKGKVQRKAVEELEALSKNTPSLSHIIQLVNDLIAVLSARQRQTQDIDKDDQELIMKLSQMYQQQLEELKAQGIQEGRQEGRQEGQREGEKNLIIRQLSRRIGEIESSLTQEIQALSIEKLEELGEALLDFTSVTDLENWLQSIK